MGDHALGLVGPGHQPGRGVGEPDRRLRPGQVERDQRGALAHPGPAASTAYSATPVGAVRGDQQFVGGAPVDHPVDRAR